MRHTILALVAAATIVLPGPADAETPIAVSVCDLVADPGAYDHKLIEITGDVLRGFESFTLSRSHCAGKNSIWLEFGGTKGSEVIYCCEVSAAPSRPHPLVVEDLETSIVEDEMLKKFDQLTKGPQGYGHAKATLIGRYFSGTKETLPGGTFWMGYGHMGMCTLLVIQQVVAVEKE